jgi:hypothetical protein
MLSSFWSLFDRHLKTRFLFMVPVPVHILRGLRRLENPLILAVYLGTKTASVSSGVPVAVLCSSGDPF